MNVERRNVWNQFLMKSVLLCLVTLTKILPGTPSSGVRGALPPSLLLMHITAIARYFRLQLWTLRVLFNSFLQWSFYIRCSAGFTFKFVGEFALNVNIGMESNPSKIASRKRLTHKVVRTSETALLQNDKLNTVVRYRLGAVA